MNLYTEQQMRDAIKMARNGARSEDNIIGSLNFIKQHSEVTMSNNKQSSVEWLYFAMEGFIHKSCRVHFVEYFEKAKAMHKEEIKDALIDGSMNSTLVEYRIPHYYNETFGGNNEQQ